MDEATSALAGLIPEYFPAALRERAKRVLSVHERIRRERGSNLVSFRFDLLKQKEYAELTQDILSLYEACIFRYGEGNYGHEDSIHQTGPLCDLYEGLYRAWARPGVQLAGRAIRCCLRLYQESGSCRLDNGPRFFGFRDKEDRSTMEARS